MANERALITNTGNMNSTINKHFVRSRKFVIIPSFRFAHILRYKTPVQRIQS